jgi:hypothetical protein
MACFADWPEMRSSLGVVWSAHVRRSGSGGPIADFDEDVEVVVDGGRIRSMAASGQLLAGLRDYVARRG